MAGAGAEALGLSAVGTGTSWMVKLAGRGLLR